MLQPFALPNRHEDADSKWVYMHAISESGGIDRTGAGRGRSTVVKAELRVTVSCDYAKLKKRLTQYRMEDPRQSNAASAVLVCTV